ncbi:unnamed protein product [Litomosoides sigmodontis]|uniref:Chondroitin proteoglycan 4 domain-containing protein n=1 Tax=Litomosoides sigmodontis TaxID=42156 RepID=A0A3P6SJI8_LITSI|nr:unnamed protein product [Litomosoides sigmodontis]
MITHFVTLLITAKLVEVNAEQQLIRQCTCDEVAPCESVAIQTILPCADQCQKFISSIGGNYQQIRSCFQQKQPVINNVIKCSENSFPNACARETATAKMLPRRYTKGIELAAINEINKELRRMGIADQITSLLAQGRRFFRCFQSCMVKKLDKCAPGCGLDLPPDNAVVQTIKTCALRSGVQTASLQDLCFCVERAGIRQLTGVCPRIQI